MRRALFLLIVLASFLAPLATQPGTVKAAARDGIVLRDCRLSRPGAGGVAARCGTLTVPEDYAEPTGRTIELNIAVVKALGGSGEPLFVLAGGPGQAATQFYAAVAPAFGPIARSHDIVLVDQRGTGGSNRLDCHFPDDFAIRTPPPAELERLSAACVAGLRGRAQFYTTSVAVRDLDAVRSALGYDALSLYGASYGTRVAQHYARRYPAHVRGLILDGVVPPDAVLGPGIAADAQRALDLTFARCDADAACHAAFAAPASDYNTLRERLDRGALALSVADPSTAKTTAVSFGPEQLGSTLRLLSYSATTAALVPLLLHTAVEGDARPLAAQFVLYSHELDAEIAYGMHNAVACTEDAPFFGAVDREAMKRTYLGTVELDALTAMCRPWPRGTRDEDLAAPLKSLAPALILSGEADPVTPPAFGERAGAGFSDVRHVVLRGQGHGQLATGCVPDLMATFLKHHTTRTLDTHCAERVAPVAFFIDFAGSAP